MGRSSRHPLFALVGLLLAPPAVAGAQENAFLFTVNTLPARRAPRIAVHADMGYGGSAIEPVGGNGFDQQLGFQARAGRWTALGRVGSDVSHPDHTFGRAEVLMDVLGGGAGPQLALGGGILHEAGGTNVMLARIVASQRARSWRADANVVLQRPLVSGRDGVDLITSVGVSRPIGRGFHAGLEALGEDLEGFWEVEAEGGAKLMVGPSLRFAPAQARWQICLGGGPILYGRSNDRVSDADRLLGSGGARTRYVVRTSLSYSF